VTWLYSAGSSDLPDLSSRDGSCTDLQSPKAWQRFLHSSSFTASGDSTRHVHTSAGHKRGTAVASVIVELKVNGDSFTSIWAEGSRVRPYLSMPHMQADPDLDV
jgi:hypothetical protein